MRYGAGGGPARTVVAVIGVLVLCLPLAGVSTLVLLPLWSWLEATAGIESVGHSGPAAWCYQAVYAACVLLVGFDPGLAETPSQVRRHSGTSFPTEPCRSGLA